MNSHGKPQLSITLRLTRSPKWSISLWLRLHFTTFYTPVSKKNNGTSLYFMQRLNRIYCLKPRQPTHPTIYGNTPRTHRKFGTHLELWTQYPIAHTNPIYYQLGSIHTSRPNQQLSHHCVKHRHTHHRGTNIDRLSPSSLIQWPILSTSSAVAAP